MQELLNTVTGLSAAWLLREHLVLERALRRAEQVGPPAPRYPSLTVIRPVRGVDLDALENARALLASQYPGEIEFIFVFDDNRDEGLPAVRTAVGERPHARILFAGPPPRGRTGKLHAMSVGMRAARGELVAFSDSDTRVAPELLRLLVDRLLNGPQVGAVFARALAASPPQTPGDVGYALMLNSWYGVFAVQAAGGKHQLPFIMGQCMVLRREALRSIGGLECADGQLVDDMYLGKRLAEAGWHNVMIDHPLHIVSGGLSSMAFLRLMRRWLMFARSGLPAAFKRSPWIRGAVVWLCLMSALMSIVHGWTFTALGAIGTLGGLCASDVMLHRAFGGAPIPLRWTWISVAVPLLGPFALISLLLHHHVDWRGRDYALDDRARLEEA